MAIAHKDELTHSYFLTEEEKQRGLGLIMVMLWKASDISQGACIEEKAMESLYEITYKRNDTVEILMKDLTNLPWRC